MSQLGQSLNTYLCFRKTHTHTHTHKYIYTKKIKIFCRVQINSWTVTPWLMDNSWKLHMRETLRACVFISTCSVCVCVCTCVFCYWHAAVLRVNFKRCRLTCTSIIYRIRAHECTVLFTHCCLWRSSDFSAFIFSSWLKVSPQWKTNSVYE